MLAIIARILPSALRGGHDGPDITGLFQFQREEGTFNMVRINSVLVVLLMVAVGLASLTGCGGSPMAAVAGTYKLDQESMKKDLQAKIDATEDPGEKMGMQMAMGMFEQMTFSITLNADGTASGVANMMGEDDVATGTWTLDGDAIAITMKGENETVGTTINGTVSGSRITLKPEGEEEMPFNMVLIKQ